MAWLSGLACIVGLAASGCVVEERHYAPPPPADTEIELEESVNIGACGDEAAFSWTVVNRQTGDNATAYCSQPILFQGLDPDTTYTFDITGYQGSKVCWQGACNVDTRYGVVTYGDCSAEITHLCGY